MTSDVAATNVVTTTEDAAMAVTAGLVLFLADGVDVGLSYPADCEDRRAGWHMLVTPETRALVTAWYIARQAEAVARYAARHAQAAA